MKRDIFTHIFPENRVGARTPSAARRKAAVVVAACPDRNADGRFMLADRILDHANDDL